MEHCLYRGVQYNELTESVDFSGGAPLSAQLCAQFVTYLLKDSESHRNNYDLITLPLVL